MAKHPQFITNESTYKHRLNFRALVYAEPRYEMPLVLDPPLVNLSGYIPEKDKAEYVKFIYESSNNQLQLVNHLFDWSQIQTGRVKFEIQRLHAQSVAYNCVSFLTGLAMRKNININ